MHDDPNRKLPPIWNIYTKEPEPKRFGPLATVLFYLLIAAIAALCFWARGR